MGIGYKVVRNYTLPISAVVLVLSVVGLVLGFHLLLFVAPATELSVTKPLGIAPGSGWDQWVAFLSVLGLLMGGWYVGEQLMKRRKFEKLLSTDKRSEFAESRKELEDLAKSLPERYKPRISEKEAEFKSRRA
jgi:hypothetical protein